MENITARPSSSSSETTNNDVPLAVQQRFEDPGDGHRTLLWCVTRLNVLSAKYREVYQVGTIDGKPVMDFHRKDRPTIAPYNLSEEQEKEYQRLLAQDDPVLSDPKRDLPSGAHGCPKCRLRFQWVKNAEDHALTHRARAESKREKISAGKAARPKVFAIENPSGSAKQYSCPVNTCKKQFTTRDVTKHLFDNINAGGHAANRLEPWGNGLWIDHGPKTGSAATSEPASSSAVDEAETGEAETGDSTPDA